MEELKLNLDDDFMQMPVIPLRGLVVFPGMNLHFDVGRRKSINALKYAMKKDQRVFLVSQKEISTDDPSYSQVYRIGTVCEIKQMIKIPNSDNLRVIVKGLERGNLVSFTQTKPFNNGVIDYVQCENDETIESNAYSRVLKKEFEKYTTLTTNVSKEVMTGIMDLNSCGELADYICSNSMLEFKQKQEILECFDSQQRVTQLLLMLKTEVDTLSIEAEIEKRTQEEIEKGQKDYYLREEMKVISDMLGDSESPIEESDEYRNKIKNLNCDEVITNKLLKECDKLMKMPQGSHEATVVRSYLDKCLQIPFGKYSKDSINLQKSRKILDKDHYGLDKVKQRIIESLAVLKRNPDFAGQIICLYGPPGVGKTSIVKSLAKSMNRKYVRVALGGVSDEAEIRGHRKTYIGAMTGKIVDSIINSQVMNPVILLDEIDKLGTDYKGDPSCALLEALDPEQNNSFFDHYIDFPIDLSKVLFITTANDTSTISAPLYDRMEVIEINSYSIEDKFNIAKKHLVKKEMLKHNLTAKEFKIADNALYAIIESYTREAGVRKLEKEIATLCRKSIIKIEEDQTQVKITNKNLKEFLGATKYEKEVISGQDLIGTVNGLAWTSVGGTILPIEISVLDGTGKIELTGNLGDVMKESAKTAVSYVRSKAKEYSIQSDFYKTKDIHIHAPEAAIPKDGPSAGLAITTALVSELTQTPIKSTVAMTGEISLKGKALAIGGLKEKSMAAYKAGCKTIIIPKENQKDLEEISDQVKESVEFIPVNNFSEILNIAFTKNIQLTNNKINNIITEDKTTNSVITQ